MNLRVNEFLDLLDLQAPVVANDDSGNHYRFAQQVNPEGGPHGPGVL